MQLYQEHRQRLLARSGQPAAHYPASVTTTWTLAFQTVQARNPAAAELLSLCAFLAPDRIPKEFIETGAAAWPPLRHEAATDCLAFNQMLEDLLHFSLIKRLGEEHLLSIHRLVQAVQQDQMEADQQQQWTERVVRALHQMIPHDPKEVGTWPASLRYLEHVQACALLIKRYHVHLPAAANLLDRTGTYLREQAAYSPAQALYQQAPDLHEHTLGTEHPDVAASLNNLAILFWEQGQYTEALSRTQQALSIREQALGPIHPQVAESLNTLAALFWSQGQYQEALPCVEQAWAIYEQALGPIHPQVAISLCNRAILHHSLGQLGEAAPLYEQALAI